MITLTPRSLELFFDYARDAGNWGGTPLVGGGREDNGNLTQLKRAGLITTGTDNGAVFIYPQTDAAPAHPLAPTKSMENPVGQRHRLPDRAATRRLTQLASPVHPPSQARPRNLATRKNCYRPADHARAKRIHTRPQITKTAHDRPKSSIHGSRLRDRQPLRD